MRRTQFRTGVVLGNGVITPIAPVNPKRVRLEIWVSGTPALPANTVLVTNIVAVAPLRLTTTSDGIVLCLQKSDGQLDVGVPPRSYQAAAQTILTMAVDIDTHGDVVQQDWWGLAITGGAGNFSLVVIETIGDEYSAKVQ